MTRSEQLAKQIGEAGQQVDIYGLIEDYRAAVRAEMKTDLLADLRDPKMEILTGDEAAEFIESNY